MQKPAPPKTGILMCDTLCVPITPLINSSMQFAQRISNAIHSNAIQRNTINLTMQLNERQYTVMQSKQWIKHKPKQGIQIKYYKKVTLHHKNILQKPKTLLFLFHKKKCSGDRNGLQFLFPATNGNDGQCFRVQWQSNFSHPWQ